MNRDDLTRLASCICAASPRVAIRMNVPCTDPIAHGEACLAVRGAVGRPAGSQKLGDHGSRGHALHGLRRHRHAALHFLGRGDEPQFDEFGGSAHHGASRNSSTASTAWRKPLAGMARGVEFHEPVMPMRDKCEGARFPVMMPDGFIGLRHHRPEAGETAMSCGPFMTASWKRGADHGIAVTVAAIASAPAFCAGRTLRMTR